MYFNHLPKDLIWTLDSLQRPRHAVNFFNVFGNSFCVYSSSVSKIYSQYDSHTTGASKEDLRLVIMPDMLQFDSIFQDVAEDAIEATDIYVFAEPVKGRHQIYMAGKTFTDNRQIKLPFQKGLKALKSGLFAEGKILPIVRQGDLREIPSQTIPYLRLHQVNTSKLDYKSSFDIDQIAKACWAALDQLF